MLCDIIAESPCGIGLYYQCPDYRLISFPKHKSLSQIIVLEAKFM